MKRNTNANAQNVNLPTSQLPPPPPRLSSLTYSRFLVLFSLLIASLALVCSLQGSVYADLTYYDGATDKDIDWVFDDSNHYGVNVNSDNEHKGSIEILSNTEANDANVIVGDDSYYTQSGKITASGNNKLIIAPAGGSSTGYFFIKGNNKETFTSGTLLKNWSVIYILSDGALGSGTITANGHVSIGGAENETIIIENNLSATKFHGEQYDLSGVFDFSNENNTSSSLNVKGIIYDSNTEEQTNISVGTRTTLELSNVNTYTGDTSNYGTLKLTVADAIKSSACVYNGNADAKIVIEGKSDSTGISQTFNSFGGNGYVYANDDESHIVTLNRDATGYYTSSRFYGVISDTDGTGTNSGKISIIKTGDGTQYLGNKNTYTGTTTINGGTLKIYDYVDDYGWYRSTVGTLGTGNIYTSDENGSGTLEFAGTGYGTTGLSQTISGDGNVAVSGGTTILSTANEYKGTTTVSGGTLYTGDAAALGTSALTVSGGTLNIGTGSTVSSLGSITALSMTDGQINFDFGTYDSANPTDFDKITLSSGTVTLSNGTINIDFASTDSASQWWAGLSSNPNGYQIITGDASSVDVSNLTLTTNSTNNWILSANNKGVFLTSGITWYDPTKETDLSSAWTFDTSHLGVKYESTSSTDTETHTQGITISAAAGEDGNVIIEAGKTLIETGKITGSNDLVKTGAGTFEIQNNTNDYTGQTTIKAGTLKLAEAGTLGSTSSVDNDGTLEFAGNGYDSTALSQDISGTGNVVVSGGKTILSGTNTYSGGTTLSGGTLVTDDTTSSQNLGNGALTIEGGTLTIGNTAGTKSSLTGISSLTMTDGQMNFDFYDRSVGEDNHDSITTNGPISITNGVINLTFKGEESIWINPESGSSSYKIITDDTNSTTAMNLSNLLDTSSKLNWDLNATSDGVYLTATTTNYWNADKTSDTERTAWVIDNTVTPTATSESRYGIVLDNNKGTKEYTGNVTFNTDGVVDVGTDSTLTLSSNNITLGTDNTMEKQGAGTLVLSSANTEYKGTTKVSAGTLKLTAENAIANSSNVINNATLVISGGADTTGYNQTLKNLSGTSTGQIYTDDNFNHTLTVDNSTNTQYDGTITDKASGASNTGTINLIKTGTGTQTLTSGNSTYSGGTTLSNGTLVIGASSTVVDDTITQGPVGTGKVTMSGGAIGTAGEDTTYTLHNQIVADGDNNNKFKFDTADTSTLIVSKALTNTDGSSSTTAGLQKTGTGTLILNQANSYTGETTIDAGTIVVKNDASLGTNSVTMNGGAIGTNTTDSITLANKIYASDTGTFKFDTADTSTLTVNGSLTNTDGTSSTTAGLQKTGTGTLILSGTNNYTGTTTVSSGILKLSGTDKISTSSNVVVESGAVLSATDSQTYNNLSGAGTLYNANDDGEINLTFSNTTNSTFTGVIQDNQYGAATTEHTATVNLVKTGTGTQTFSSANNYSGTTTIKGGTLKLTDSGTLGKDTISTGVDSTNKGTLEFAGTGYDSSNPLTQTIEGTGDVKVSGGTTVLSASNTYTGNTTVSGGTLITDDTNALGTSGTLTVNGGTLTIGNGTESKSSLSGITSLEMSSGQMNFDFYDHSGGDDNHDMITVETGPVTITGGAINLSFVNDDESTWKSSVPEGGYKLIAYTDTTALSTTDLSSYLDAHAKLNWNLNSKTGGVYLTVFSGTFANYWDVGDETDFEKNWTIHNTDTPTKDTTRYGIVLDNNQGTKTYAKSITFNTDGVIDIGTGSTLTLNPDSTSTIALNSHTLEKQGAGTLELKSASSGYDGTIKVSGGTLKLSAQNAIASSSNVVNNATIEMTQNQTLNNLSGTSTDAEIQTGGKQLTVNTTSNTEYSGQITGSGSLKKTGSGKLSLLHMIPGTGDNGEYKGTTTIAAGTLQVESVDSSTGAATTSMIHGLYSGDYDGTKAASEYPTLESTGGITIDDTSHYVGIIKAVDSSNNKQTVTIDAADAMVKLWSPSATVKSEANFVLNSGNLNMKGYYEGNLDVEGGSFSAGNSIGEVDVNGNVTFHSGSTWLIEISGANGDTPASVDKVTANGFTLESGSLIHVDASPTIMQGQTFEVLSASNPFSVSEDVWNSYLDTSSREMWEFIIATVDGTSTISLQARESLVPEPSTWALLIMGCAGLYFMRKRKAKK